MFFILLIFPGEPRQTQEASPSQESRCSYTELWWMANRWRSGQWAARHTISVESECRKRDPRGKHENVKCHPSGHCLLEGGHTIFVLTCIIYNDYMFLHGTATTCVYLSFIRHSSWCRISRDCGGSFGGSFALQSFPSFGPDGGGFVDTFSTFGAGGLSPQIGGKHGESEKNIGKIFHALEVCCWNWNLFHLSSSGGDSQPQDLTTGTFGEDATTVPGGGWIGFIGRDKSGQMQLKSMGVLLSIFGFERNLHDRKKWQVFKNDEWYWNDDGYKKQISIDWQIV